MPTPKPGRGLDVRAMARRFVKTWDPDDDGVTAAAFTDFGCRVARACARVAREATTPIKCQYGEDAMENFNYGVECAADAIRRAVRRGRKGKGDGD